MKSTLGWKLKTAEIEDAVKRMERLKSLISCAMTNDLSTVNVTKGIKYRGDETQVLSELLIG